MSHRYSAGSTCTGDRTAVQRTTLKCIQVMLNADNTYDIYNSYFIISKSSAHGRDPRIINATYEVAIFEVSPLDRLEEMISAGVQIIILGDACVVAAISHHFSLKGCHFEAYFHYNPCELLF